MSSLEQRTQLTAGDLQIDLRSRRVIVGGREAALTTKEYELLCHLAEHPGWVWTHQQLLESVWGYEFGDSRVVLVHVANLRRKLEAISPQSRFIETIRGVGYRFEAWSAVPAEPETRGTAAGVPFTAAAQADIFVGRVPELEALRSALATAMTGTAQLAMVGGDIGIGKTRLAEEFARRAVAQGADVIWGLCREQGASSWEPWPEIVRACVSLGGPNVDGARALQLLLGTPEQGAPSGAGNDEAPGCARERIVEAIGDALAAAAERKPLVVVLEDIHWADASSLLCLQRLCVPSMHRWLLLATYRDFEIERSPRLGELIASVARAGGLTLMLRPLAHSEVERLMAQGSQDHSATLVDEIFQVTAGNPFFVRELLRLFALRQGDRGVLSELPRQEGVRQVIGRRIGTLSSDCVRLLELVSVIGVRFPTELAQKASGLPLTRCAALLDEAQTAQVLHGAGAGTLTFSHQLLREVVYLSLPGSRREMLHARVGETLETLWAGELQAHAAELAHHFAGSGDPHYAAKALSYCIMAGHVAGIRYAWEDAVYWLRRALELRECYPSCTLEPARLAALHEELGDALFESGHVDAAADAFQDGIRSDFDAAALDAGRRYRKLGDALVLTPQVTRATLAYLEAERVMGEPTSAKPPEWWEEWLGMELQRCWGHYYAADFAGLAALAERIRPFVEARGTPAHRGAFYNCLWIGESGAHRYVTTERGLEHARMSLAAYFTDGRLRSRCEGEWVMSLALLWLPDHPDEAESHLRRFLTLAEEYGDVTFQMEARWGLAMWHRWRGHVGRVQEQAERSLALNAGRNVACYSQCAKGHLAWMACREGDLPRARRLATEALDEVEHDEEHTFAYQWIMRWPLIGVHIASCEMDEATAHVRALLDPSQQAMPSPLEGALAEFLAHRSDAAAQHALRLARRHGYL